MLQIFWMIAFIWYFCFGFLTPIQLGDKIIIGLLLIGGVVFEILFRVKDPKEDSDEDLGSQENSEEDE